MTAAGEELQVDARGLACPLPIFRLAKAARGAAPGVVLHLTGSDPAIVPDVRAFCDAMGYELLRVATEAGVYEAWVRKPA